MKNKIEDLRNHLFAQLERLSEDEDMKNPIKLEREVKRAKAISEVAAVIVNTAKAETDYLHVTGKLPEHRFMPGSTEKKVLTTGEMKVS